MAKESEPEEIRIIEGKRYRKIHSGYTVRQFFSHSTPERGSGPGWDMRWEVLKEYSVTDPAKLPDEPYYQWELIEEEES
jgi:hypothetical protein